jgi:AcrR family transcriptional regulator
MAARSLTRDLIVEAAVDLVDERQLYDVGVSSVADVLGVQPSALYHHVENLEALRTAVAAVAVDRLAETLRDAAIGRSGAEAVRPIAHAYRTFAHDHAGLYSFTVSIATEDPARSAASRRVVEVLRQVLEGWGVTGDRAVHGARVLRSALHGFVTLEYAGDFVLDQDPDDSFDQLVEVLVESLAQLAT